MTRTRTARAPQVLTSLLLAALLPTAGTAQEVTVVPGPEYDASGFARFWLGDGWRSLWLTPVRAPVLDLGTFSGGLTPERQGGGNQSVTLHMVDADGVGWIFRSIDKYPEQGLPRELDGSFLGNLVSDAISGLHPGSHFVMPRLLEAAGILHLDPELYVMPDDPRLGEFRETFAGMLGEIELKPNEGPDDTPGFAGSTKIKDADKVLEDLEETRGYRVDAEEFLRARLIDMWVGDPDRGSDQWRFARFGEEGDEFYRPIPRDRDWAFVRADGFLTARFRSFYPKLLVFAESMPEIEPLTYSAHILDRTLLTALTRDDFARAARTVQQTMTDAVIDQAIANMPPEFVTVAADEMRSKLIARRAQLTDVADRFYEWLATDVDVRGTDEANLAQIERREDGAVRVQLSQLDESMASGTNGAAGTAWYDRTFLPDETDEVRIYLHGGDDRAVATGADAGSIKVRVIGGGGDDVLEDETGTVRFYDDRGDNQARGAASVSTKGWEWADVPEGLRFGKDWAPDYGSEHSLFSPTVQHGEGAGIIIGGGPTFTDYGFRRAPFRSRLGFNVLYATESGGWGADLNGEHRMENSRLAITLDARAVEFDAFRFYGFGNDTPDPGGDASLVMLDRIQVYPALSWDIGPRPGKPLPDAEGEAENEDDEDDDDADDVERAFLLGNRQGLRGSFSIGPYAHWTRLRAPAGNPLAGGMGEDGFGRIGAQALLELANTDQGAAPRRGYRLFAQAAGFPAAWDAEEAFGTALAQLSGYMPLFGSTHLAARVGGEAVMGDHFPVFDAASLGGRRSVRGYRFDRYTGDAAGWGNLELRIPIDTVNFIVNGELGVFGLADAGRVWVDGESTGGWHTAWGGGLWFSAFDRAVSIAWARGDHADGRFYIWQGLPF